MSLKTFRNKEVCLKEPKCEKKLLTLSEKMATPLGRLAVKNRKRMPCWGNDSKEDLCCEINYSPPFSHCSREKRKSRIHSLREQLIQSILLVSNVLRLLYILEQQVDFNPRNLESVFFFFFFFLKTRTIQAKVPHNFSPHSTKEDTGTCCLIRKKTRPNQAEFFQIKQSSFRSSTFLIKQAD